MSIEALLQLIIEGAQYPISQHLDIWLISNMSDNFCASICILNDNSGELTNIDYNTAKNIIADTLK